MNGLLSIYCVAVLLLAFWIWRKGHQAGKWLAPCFIALAVVVWPLLNVSRFLPISEGGDPQHQEAPFDVLVSKAPLLQAIREKEPAIFAALRQQALALGKQGKSQRAVIETLQPTIQGLLTERLQRAPDINVVRFMQASLEQTAQIEKLGADACFRFLFPAVKGGFNPKALPEAVSQRRMAADAEMLRASYGPGQHTPALNEQARAYRDLQPIMEALEQRYGNALTLITAPQEAKGKEAQVCDMTQVMWQQVLKLPQERAAGIIRTLVAMGHSQSKAP
ncbi:topoisomerase II [Apirhabdus apintestini]|nr:topoisomerase II [Enterobacteriaceae bacterium CA-0114]